MGFDLPRAVRVDRCGSRKSAYGGHGATRQAIAERDQGAESAPIPP